MPHPGIPAGAEQDYAYVLGLYLGDGCLSAAGRTYRLRITLDTAYSEIIIGVETRRSNAKNVSVARRASVAILNEFLGPKDGSSRLSVVGRR